MTPAIGTGGVERPLVPVRLVNGRYVVVDVEDVTQAHFQESLRHLVERRYQKSDEYVEFNGRLVHTNAFLSEDGSDGYTEFGRDGMPVDIDSPKPDLVENRLRSYLSRTIERLAKSDGITADTALELRNKFVEPSLSWVTADGVSEARWAEIRGQTRLVLLGGAGAGKTSLFRRLAYDWATESLGSHDPTIPVYVQLRELDPEVWDTTDLRLLFSSFDRDLHELTEADGTAGRILLLLDGLDELPDAHVRRKVLRLIDMTCAALPTIRVMLATREPAYERQLDGFSHARLGPFGNAQISQWVLNFLASRLDPGGWQTFIDHLWDAPDVHDLTGNPLMLSIVTRMYAQERIVPENKALVLQGCLEALLQDWDAVRGVRRWQDSPAMARQMRAALMDVSLAAIKDGRNHFIVQDLDRVLDEMVGIRLGAAAILDACMAAGVVRTEPAGWTFVHRTFQEYFAARYLVDSTNNIRGFFGNEDVNPGRDSVWELACAMASDASDLLQVKSSESDTGLLQRASLLAHAFRQDLTASRAAVSLACRAIAVALERNAEQLRPVSAHTMRRLNDTNQWRSVEPSEEAVRIFAVNDATSSGMWLARTLRAIHQARLGTAADSLRIALEGSDEPTVRALAWSMTFDGWCRIYSSSDQEPWLARSKPNTLTDFGRGPILVVFSVPRTPVRELESVPRDKAHPSVLEMLEPPSHQVLRWQAMAGPTLAEFLPASLRRHWRFVRHLSAGRSMANLAVVRNQRDQLYVLKRYHSGISVDADVARRLTGLNRASLVAPQLIGYDQGQHWELLEFMPGGSLEDLIVSSEGPPMAKPAILEVVQQVAEALDDLGRDHLLVRYLRPSKVLIRTLDPVSIALTDFVSSDPADGQPVGFNPAPNEAIYVAPEFSGGVLTESLNWWGLGVLISELLVGRSALARMCELEPVALKPLWPRVLLQTKTVDRHLRPLYAGLLDQNPFTRWSAATVREWLAGDDR